MMLRALLPVSTVFGAVCGVVVGLFTGPMCGGVTGIIAGAAAMWWLSKQAGV